MTGLKRLSSKMEEITQGQELGVNMIAPLYLLFDIVTTYSIT